jgi:hypothetical protein
MSINRLKGLWNVTTVVAYVTMVMSGCYGGKNYDFLGE